MGIDELLGITLDKKASDLHLSTGLAPMIRIDGELQYLDKPVIDKHTMEKLIADTMNEKQKKQFQDNLEIDYAIPYKNLGRFRVNAFHQTRGPSASFRPIPIHIKTLEELGLPPILKKLTELPNGIVLLTGPTGSGKSTTLAALIEIINQRDHDHILTIEDPVEFIHAPKLCLINQREVGTDTLSFAKALRSSLREDPDDILVGEMRDLETIRLALTAAETGHLVFATLHTASAAKTINRIIDVFPGEEKNLVRSMLSESLRAVICQSLIKKKGGGRIAAFEIMFCTPAVRNLIREDKIPQIYSTIQTGSVHGMVTLDQYLSQLVKQGLIEQEVAASVAAYRDSLNQPL